MLKLSTAWNFAVDDYVRETPTCSHMFKATTLSSPSPIDRLEVITPHISHAFSTLMYSIGRQRFLSNSSYCASYGIGSITLLCKPIHRKMMQYKVIINPSRANMSLRQLCDWLRYIAGPSYLSSLKVARVDLKVDDEILNTADTIKRLWWMHPFRKYQNYLGTLYLGTKTSSKRLVVYDKAKQMNQNNCILTRIELRQRYEPSTRPSVLEFLRKFCSHNPFEEVLLINASVAHIDLLTRKYGKVHLGDLIASFKKLTLAQRIQVLKCLGSAVSSLSNLYQSQRNAWLNNL